MKLNLCEALTTQEKLHALTLKPSAFHAKQIFQKYLRFSISVARRDLIAITMKYLEKDLSSLDSSVFSQRAWCSTGSDKSMAPALQLFAVIFAPVLFPLCQNNKH